MARRPRAPAERRESRSGFTSEARSRRRLGRVGRGSPRRPRRPRRPGSPRLASNNHPGHASKEADGFAAMRAVAERPDATFSSTIKCADGAIRKREPASGLRNRISRAPGANLRQTAARGAHQTVTGAIAGPRAGHPGGPHGRGRRAPPGAAGWSSSRRSGGTPRWSSAPNRIAARRPARAGPSHRASPAATRSRRAPSSSRSPAANEIRHASRASRSSRVRRTRYTKLPAARSTPASHRSIRRDIRQAPHAGRSRAGRGRSLVRVRATAHGCRGRRRSPGSGRVAADRGALARGARQSMRRRQRVGRGRSGASRARCEPSE